MNKESIVLGLDVGTTSVRCIAFNSEAKRRGEGQCPLETTTDTKGTAVQDPDAVFSLAVKAIKDALGGYGKPLDLSLVKALGITTQRSSFTIWEKATGKPLIPLILYCDSRSKKRVEEINNSYVISAMRSATGLLAPFTSNQMIRYASVFKFTTTLGFIKLQMVLEENPKLREGVESGVYLYGTTDTWIVWKLTSGATYATDPSNANSSGMYEGFNLKWAEDTLKMLTRRYFPPIPRLPQVKDSSDDYGSTDPKYFGVPIPIRSLVGDQQSAACGNGCFNDGDVKITLGTSATMDIVTGSRCDVPTISGVYPLVGWKIGNKVTYMLDGMLDSLGTTVSWLVKNEFAKDYADLNTSSPKPDRSEDVYFVPAFNGTSPLTHVGITTPNSNPRARGMFIGLTSKTTKEQMRAAVLESFGFALRQIREAIRDDIGIIAGEVEVGGVTKKIPIRVDGGASRNDPLCQAIADAFDCEVHRPAELECTSLGAAFLAGLSVGVWKSTDELKSLVPIQTVFRRKQLKAEVDRKYHKYVQAAHRAKDWYEEEEETEELKK